MSGSRLAEKYGVTPGKLILVGVLFVTFVAVVYWNFFRDASGNQAAAAATEPAPPSPAESETTRPADRPAHPPEASQPEAGPRKPWPRFELTETIARDPFALPERFPHPAPPQVTVVPERSAGGSQSAEASDEQRATELAALQQQGVQLILRNGHEYVAKIGDRQVRVGDKIGGFRVVDISVHGVEVELEGDASP